MLRAGAASPHPESMSAAGARPSLQEHARRGFGALVEAVPRIVWSGVKGAVVGFFAIGFAAAAVVGGLTAYNVLFDTALPGWLLLANAVVVPLSFSLAGAYAGGVRGVLAGLARQLVERNLIEYLYAFVRPVLLRTARSLAERTGPVTRSELSGRLHELAKERVRHAVEGDGAPSSIIDRLERRAAARLQHLLVAAALTPNAGVQDRQAAIAELESTGIQRIEETIADTLMGLYAVQQVIAFGVAIAVSAVPYVIYAVL